ncbi:MAG TPA: condensation domain-containing protein [Bryobacteraceae bacterium]|nr:condensation domain-containing protein [Bryobacteraceae bacterium]HPU70843.1 condensation domain-containing protein [Bryobacteraceae bacterium]
MASATRSDVWSAMGGVLRRQASGPPLVRRPRTGPLELSCAQERLWSLAQSEPGTACYNVPLAWRIDGSLDLEALRRSLNAIIRRHEILRTIFPNVDGRPAAIVREDFELEVGFHDLRAQPQGAADRARELLRRPFELERIPPVRAEVVCTGEQQYLLLFAVHQIVFDGGSMRVFSRELAELYRAFTAGREPRLPELPLQYSDIGPWQAEMLQSEALAEPLAYWQSKLDRPYTPLALPVDRAPAAAAGTAPAARFPFTIERELTAQLAAMAGKARSSLFAVLLAGLNALLCRYTGQEDVIIFASLAARTRPELRDLIGLIANVLPLRTDLAGDPSFTEILERSRETLLGGLAHQDLPFEKIMESLHTASGWPHQVMAIHQRAPLPVWEASGATFTPCEEIDNGETKFALLFEFTESKDGTHVSLKYRTDLFDPPTIGRLAADYEALLRTAAGNPGICLSQLPPAQPPKPRAESLAVPASQRAEFAAPRDELERELTRIWEKVIGRSPIGIHDDFFQLGGTSLMAARVFAHIRHATGRTLRLAALLEAPTIAQLAEKLRAPLACSGSSLVLLRQEASGSPLFVVPGVGGRVLELVPLASHLQGQPVYGFEATELDEANAGTVRIEDLAQQYAAELRSVQPYGPYYLGGVCFGAFVAFEIARQLTEAGESVALLALLDPPPPLSAALPWRARVGIVRRHLERRLRAGLPEACRWMLSLAGSQLRSGAHALLRILYRLMHDVIHALPGAPERVLARPEMNELRLKMHKASRARALNRYVPRPYPGDLLLIQTEQNGLMANLTAEYGWRALARGTTEVHIVPASHDDFVRESRVQFTADHLRDYLSKRRTAVC